MTPGFIPFSTAMARALATCAEQFDGEAFSPPLQTEPSRASGPSLPLCPDAHPLPCNEREDA